MNYMFYDCSSLENLIIGNFNTNKVKNIDGIFDECSSLKGLNKIKKKIKKNMCSCF
jgi:surface protein